MIDIHILKTRDTAEYIATKAQHPLVNVYMVPGVIGDILKGRIRGFLSGTSEYVSFLDDDDDLNLEDYYEFVQYVHDSQPAAVYSNAIMMHNGIPKPLYEHKEWTYDFHLSCALPIHQMIVVKRTIMENALEALCTFPYLYEIRNFPEQFIYSIIAMNTPWIFKGSMFPYIWNYSLKQRADSTEDVITARRAMLNLLNG